MLTRQTLAELLQHAKQLVGIHHPSDILIRSCQAAKRYANARSAFAVHLSAPQAWQHGLHMALREEEGRVAAVAERSALFALHRRLALTLTPYELRYAESHAGIFAGLAGPAAKDCIIYVAPIRQRRGQLAGSLAVVLDQAPSASEAAVIEEIADIAGTTLEGAHRLALARHEQERLQLLAEASEEALWDWNLQSGEFWWGGGIRNIFGRGGESVQNTFAWKLDRMHADDLHRVQSSLQQALNSMQSSWVEEYRFRRADDSWITVEDRGYFLREADGRAYRVVGSLRDITSVKRLLEGEQQARAEAEQASRAKDEFLALLGHELRNPLAPIVTAVHLLKMRGFDEIERERSIIERQANHMVRLVDDLLDVSRITRGMITLKKEQVELYVLVTKAIEMASPLIEERRHHLDVFVPQQGLEIDADPARFAQVIANLLTNAAKYTESGGRITVRAARDGDELKLSVTDTGIGIDPEMQPRIFDIFVQERQALDRSRGGLGLGLSLVRSLVALHGGKVSVESPGRGKGSSFIIRMPVATVRPLGSVGAMGTSPRLSPPNPNGRRVLVVDDNVDAADMLRAWLEIAGHSLRVAHDGIEALRIADEFAPDIVLLDIGLPVLDGYQVARLLRERPRGESLRIVAVTGYGQDSRTERGAGFDAHLVKPVSLDLLEDTLRKFIAPLPPGSGFPPAAAEPRVHWPRSIA